MNRPPLRVIPLLLLGYLLSEGWKQLVVAAAVSAFTLAVIVLVFEYWPLWEIRELVK